MLLWGLGLDAWLSLTVVIVTFMVLVFFRLPSDYVFMAGVGVLLLSGVLDAQEAFAGFSSNGVLAIGMLYIVVAGLKETGGLHWISHFVLGRPKSYTRALFKLMVPVSLLSSFLNNTPVVALYIPIVTDWCRRIQVQPSRMLIPLSYAAILGGTCTLVGTSTNLVVNSLVQVRFQSEGLEMFEISKIGIPVTCFGILFIALFARFLPRRKAFDEIIADPREYTLEMKVVSGSSMENKTIEEAGLRHLPGCFLAELIRSNHIYSAVSPNEILQGDDCLVFVGNVSSIKSLYDYQGLEPASNQLFKLDHPRHKRILVESVVSNTCPLVGKSIRDGRFRQRYNAVVVAATRNGERIKGRIGDIVLRPGDTLLVESHAGFIPRQKESRDFYLIGEVANFSPKEFSKAPIAFAILASMVFLMGTGWLSMLKAAFLAAGCMLATGCCSIAHARRSIEWEVLLTIAAALGLGAALEKTDAATALAAGMLSFTGDNPWLALAIVCLITSLFTEVITNNAAAVLVFPVAISAAENLNVNPMPFIMGIMISASASFATPIGYQTNLMIYGPGGYRFRDFMRIGVPLNLLIVIVTLFLAPLIWPFQ